jgi:hypothetical protein
MGGVYNTVNLHLYHYAGNNPLKYTDPNGKWTFSLGVSGNITFGGGWGGGLGFALGYSKTDGISIGFYATGGETQGTLSAGIGITGSLNVNADSVRDLEGSGQKSLGVSAPIGGIDIATDENYKLDPLSGFSVTVGKGVPIPEGHGMISETKTASISSAEVASKIESLKQGLISGYIDMVITP